MKKYLTLLLFTSLLTYGQNIQINLFCYKQGDTLSQEVINKTTVIEVHNLDDNTQKMKLVKWSLSFSSGGQKKMYKSDPKSGYLLYPEIKTELIKSLKKTPIKVVFDEFVVSFPDGRIMSLGSIIFYASKDGGMCYLNRETSDKSHTYKGKLLTGKDHNEPLVNQKVTLKDNKNSEVLVATTDKYGDFNFKGVNTKKSYKIEVAKGPNVKDDQLFIANQDGANIRSFKKIGNDFVYELLPIELSKLENVEIDDTELTLTNFTNSKNNELSVLKDILFEVNSINIPMESKPMINKIVSSMKKNKSLKLSIIGHTDSQGDDEKNKQLSFNRANNVMNYFLDQGIEKDRLKVEGLGETKLLNRCKNGVDCSETEHKLNRRTEFVFFK